MSQAKKGYRSMMSFLSGGIAGAISKTVIAPIERVKYLFITSNRKFTYKLFFSDFAFIVREHGVFNLWRGNTLSILRIFPHAAIDFTVFDFMRERFYRNDGTLKQKIRLFLCGSFAGLCSLTVTTPLDFLRVRLAMEKDNFSYKNNTNAMMHIHKKEGVAGFYNGYRAAVCGILIYHGSSFFIFTKLKEIVKLRAPESYSKWYVDFLLGAISAGGQLIAYPFDVIRKRMQGQTLLLEKKEITRLQNYRELIRSIYNSENGVIGFYKGMSLNVIKAPLASATAWTVKNYLNRHFDKKYDL